MTPAVLAALLGLALVDSTSFGTLLLPLAMLTHDRLRVGRVMLYLAVIGGFYAALGVLLLAGAHVLTQWWSAWGESRTMSWILLGIGLAMLIGSFWPDTPWAKRARQEAERTGRGGRRAQWRDRVVGEQSRAGSVVGIALAAGMVEAASMLPYLGAIGILSTLDVGAATRWGLLAAYVLVMLVPALALLALRVSFDARLTPVLTRVNDWLERHTSGAFWWVIGIVGFFLAADSATRLSLFH